MKKVLVVDDELDLLDGIQSLLALDGYHVHCAEGLNKAASILTKESIDVIVSDLRMPDGDGLELLKRVRQQFVNPPPFILATAFGGIFKSDLRELGVFKLISKPFDFEELKATIQSAVS